MWPEAGVSALLRCSDRITGGHCCQLKLLVLPSFLRGGAVVDEMLPVNHISVPLMLGMTWMYVMEQTVSWM